MKYSNFSRDRIVNEFDFLIYDSDFLSCSIVLLENYVSLYDYQVVRQLVTLDFSSDPRFKEQTSFDRLLCEHSNLFGALANGYASQRTLHGKSILKTTEALLIGGANPNFRNNLESRTVLDICVCDDYMKPMADLLKKYGANGKGGQNPLKNSNQKSTEPIK